MAGVLGSLSNVTEALDAVAKGASFIREINEVQEDYQDLCTEIFHLQNYLKRAQKNLQSSSLAESWMPPIVKELQEILKQLENIQTEVKSRSSDDAFLASRRSWLIKNKKIEKLVRRARNARVMLSEGVQWQIFEQMVVIQSSRTEMASDLVMIKEASFQVNATMQLPLAGPQPKIMQPESRIIYELSNTDDSKNDTSDETNSQLVDCQYTSVEAHRGLQRTALTLGNTIVSYTTNFPTKRRKCAEGCQCACHAKPWHHQTPVWIRQLVGTLVVNYRSWPGASKWSSRCKCDGGNFLLVNYRPPTWLWKTILCIKASYTEAGPHISLRPARIVMLSDNLWIYIRSSVESVQHYLQHGNAIYPDDMMEDGTDVLWNIITCHNYDMLDLLLQMWGDSLRQKQISRQVWYKVNFHLSTHQVGKREEYHLNKLASYVDDEPEMQNDSARLHEAVKDDYRVEEAIGTLANLRVIDDFDMTGYTPLHNAISYGHGDVVQQLMDAGADIDAKTFDGMTPLMLAAKMDDTDCMRRLLLARCRIMDVGNSGMTALHYAADNACADAVHLLLSQGASPSARDIWGRTPLHKLALSDSDAADINATAKLLLRSDGVDIDAQESTTGNTPTLYAILNNNLALLECLAEAGSSFRFADAFGRNLLHFAASLCTADVLDFLAHLRLSDIDTHIKDNYRYTAWNTFMFCINAPTCALGNSRRPTPDEQSAFVSLYKGIRNRNLRRDVLVLQQASDALNRQDNANAAECVASLATVKAENYNHQLASFYRGITQQIRAGNRHTAANAIKDDIEELTDKILTSPWDQPSYFDRYYPDDSDDESALDECDSEPDELPSRSRTNQDDISHHDTNSEEHEQSPAEHSNSKRPRASSLSALNYHKGKHLEPESNNISNTYAAGIYEFIS